MTLSALSQRKPAAAVFLLFSALLFHAPLILADLAYPTRDFYLHYSWVEQVGQSLREGNWYPRWMPLAADGLGQPVFYYYPPLFHLLTGHLSRVTPNHWTAMKLVVIAASWLTGWLTYNFVRRRATAHWPLLAAILMQCTPLMAFVFWRLGAWPWYASFPLFLALLFWTLEFAERPTRIDPRISIAIALLAATHILSAFVALLCLPIAVAWSGNGETGARRNPFSAVLFWGLSCLLGLGLVAVYLYPALTTLSLVSPERWAGGDLDWRSSFVFPVITAVHFGVRYPLFQWAVPVFVLAPIVAAVFALRGRKNGDPRLQSIGALLAVSFVSLFFASEISYPIWKVAAPLQLVQFPSRFLIAAAAGGLLACLLCLAPDRSLNIGRGRYNLLAASLAASLCAAMAIMGYSAAAKLIQVEPDRAITASGIAAPEYFPATAGFGWREYVSRGGLAHECERLGIRCTPRVNGAQHRVWSIESDREAALRLPVFAFPAWSLELDGVSVPGFADPTTGLLSITVPAGSHEILLAWTGLHQERTGAIVSVISALGLLAMCVLSRRAPVGKRAGRG